MAGLVAGSWIFAEFSGALKKTVQKWGEMGKVLLPDLMHVASRRFRRGFGRAAHGGAVRLGKDFPTMTLLAEYRVRIALFGIRRDHSHCAGRRARVSDLQQSDGATSAQRNIRRRFLGNIARGGFAVPRPLALHRRLLLRPAKVRQAFKQSTPNRSTGKI